MMAETRRRSFTTALLRLRRDRRGGAMLIFALSLLPIATAAGLAVDSLLAMLARSEMNQAADAAALAGVREISSPSRDADIRKFFAMNFPSGRLGAVVEPLDIVVNEAAGTVKVTATATMPTRMMRLLNRDSMTISASATAESGGKGNGFELALVLDVTGSMNETDHSDPNEGTKIGALKRAAGGLLDIVYQDRETVPNLSVAVVPFAGRVNTRAPAGPADRGWMKGTPPGNWSGCLDVRYGPNAGSDAPPSVEKFPDFQPLSGTKYGQYSPQAAQWLCPDISVLPLTADKGRVAKMIDGLVADGNTRTDIGMAWGWRTLSPKWRGLWGGAAGTMLPADYGTPGVSKVVVLMTDGMNTPEQSGDPESKQQTEANLARTCEAMKAEGIVVYAVLFQTPAELIPLYSACATSDEHFLVASSNAALEAAFGKIGTQLRDKYVRLIR